MSTIGAVAIWGPMAPAPVGVPAPAAPGGREVVRLTRRGRLLRSLALAAVAVVLAAFAVAHLTGGPARAGADPTGPVSTPSVTVEQGDSLWSIARRVAPEADPREVVYALRELNGLPSNLIQPGQVLLVPSRR